MIVSCAKEFCVQYDRELDVLRVAWVAGRNMRGFRDAFGKLPKLVSQLEVGRVVLDLNALPEISVYDQLWLSTSFMPAVISLPLRQAVVVLSPTQVYNHQVVEGLLMAVQFLIRFDVQFFAQPDAALQWLTNYSAHLPALQAEWAQHCSGASHKTDEVAEPMLPYGSKK